MSSFARGYLTDVHALLLEIAGASASFFEDSVTVDRLVSYVLRNATFDAPLLPAMRNSLELLDAADATLENIDDMTDRAVIASIQAHYDGRMAGWLRDVPGLEAGTR